MDDNNLSIGIIALVPDRWRGIWMPRHQVMSRLARHFRVVWVEPAENWRQYWLPGKVSRVDVQKVSARIPNFDHYVPGRWYPDVHFPGWLGRAIQRRRIMAARKRLQRAGCEKIVLYLWRPNFSFAVDAVPNDMVCYHIDDEYQFSANKTSENPVETILLKRSDQVFIHSSKLLEMKGQYNANTSFVPNGVDFELFSRTQDEPLDLAAIPRPRACYVGVIKSQLDFNLLIKLSRLREDWNFVFVGPQNSSPIKAADIDILSGLPNVHFLGNRQLRELPGYMQHSDACMMCYKVNAYTDCIYPLKAHEYLASGTPVVSSPIHSMRDLSGVIRLARTEEDWSDALNQIVKNQARGKLSVRRRQTVAAAHDWDVLVDQIAMTINHHCKRYLRMEPLHEQKLENELTA